MKGRKHTAEQVIRKLREGERLAAEGSTVAEVAKALEISEQTYSRSKCRSAMRPEGSSAAPQCHRARALHTLREMVGTIDPNDYKLTSTVIALSDELAAAADLAFGKLKRVPFVLIRGVDVAGDGNTRQLIRDPGRDLFR